VTTFDADDRAAILQVADAFATKRVAPAASAIDESREFPRALYGEMGELGLFGLWAEEAYGGIGRDLHTFLGVTERLARKSATIALNYANGNEPTTAILSWGSDEMKQHWLPRILSGAAIPCYSITEAAGGSDVAAISTSAMKVPEGYRINGTKAFCTNGSVGDVFVVLARDGGASNHAMSLFVVSGDTPGLSAGRDERLIGLHGSPTSELIFEDVFVPQSALLGEEGAGFRYTMEVLDEARLSAAACSVGIARGALEIALDYARARESFGQPIIKHQGLAFLLADMTTRVAAASALVASAAETLDTGGPSRFASAQAAMAKTFATDVGMSVTTDAVQVLGGYGLVQEYGVERMMRDAKAFQIFDGTNQIQALILGRYLERHGLPLS
jgi:alkylation response protein AidB-like acyl-CoA dehydrogenase